MIMRAFTSNSYMEKQQRRGAADADADASKQGAVVTNDSTKSLVKRLLLLVGGLGISGIIFMLRRRKMTGCCSQDCKSFVERLHIRSQAASTALQSQVASSFSSGAGASAIAATEAPLKDLTFGVRDSFDIEWHVTGFGSPEWARTHGMATQNAPAVEALLNAGAICVGKTVMDEMGYSLDGVTNEQYAMPVNPVMNSRMVGGSSCGSAVAVAANLVDFALGIDTIGDVRLPAACCGVLGIRSSHGIISCVGNVPTAPNLDAVGWFARDPKILRQVGLVSLQLSSVLREEGQEGLKTPRRIYIADDFYKSSTFLIEHSLDVFLRAVNKVYGRQVIHHMDLGTYLTQKVPTLRAFHNDEPSLFDSGNSEGIGLARDCMLMIYRDEFLKTHSEWMSTFKPKLGKGIHGRVRATYQITSSTSLVPTARRVKEEIQAAMNDLLKHESLLVLPAIPGLPPKVKEEYANVEVGNNQRSKERFQSDTSLLMCVPTMAGCPAASMPTGALDGVPLAIQVVSKVSGDHLLLDTLLALYPAVLEDTKTKSNLPPLAH